LQPGARQLDMKPIDLHAVINDSLALVVHDMKARQIEATVNLSPNSCVISGDQVLLEQVLVNLLINAMDAMAETPPARRHITIRSEVRAADAEVSVRDAGTGLPAHISRWLRHSTEGCRYTAMPVRERRRWRISVAETPPRARCGRPP
jgi:C4-dicarboxylate-specific signal transduction histidine kinase